ncbi:lysosomal acid phosphatase-like isoform X2 [Gigantopelta aegis]|uniref:lysosomal acid phosphatase-like isoform X2 n=1 Tax=Gigantopelta aegis TaxID=1735272 RepID=UPI001B88D36B|nr:lysosomal acid phosphatase-like isoform X2 [Gigantopelta aegis]
MILSNYEHFLSVLLLIVFLDGVSVSQPSLRLVQVIYRHGDRSPTFTYPTDPHQEDAWPQGFGQLSTVGMAQAYELGQFLRQQYSGFLNSTYIRSQIHVRSSDKDRTLMTASTVLWGLFPASGSQVWKPGSTWQPIPVHTVPLDEDLLIYAHCPAYDKLYKKLLASPIGQKIEHKNKALIDYMAKHSGLKPSLINLLEITNPLFCEKANNMDFPEWLKKDNTFEKIMKFWDVKAQLKVNTTDLIRIKVGVLLGELQQHIDHLITYRNISEKMFMYSAHDTNIAAILNGLKLFDGHHPEYCSCLMFELYEISNHSFGVQLYYREHASQQTQLLKIPGCSSSMCSVEEFASVLKDLIPADPKASCSGKEEPSEDVSATEHSWWHCGLW